MAKQLTKVPLKPGIQIQIVFHGILLFNSPILDLKVMFTRI